MKTSQNKKAKRWSKRKESLEERVHRHLNDRNSEITDEDIKNVRTELEIRGETNPESAQENAKKDKKNPGAPSKNKGEKKQTTPWNLLSDGFD
jgi:hypothetical protein